MTPLILFIIAFDRVYDCWIGRTEANEIINVRINLSEAVGMDYVGKYHHRIANKLVGKHIIANTLTSPTGEEDVYSVGSVSTLIREDKHSPTPIGSL